MVKFNRAGRGGTATSPVRSVGVTGTTHEGAPGFGREPKGELFLLSVTNMVGEDTFYERAGDRDDRFRRLCGQVAVADPAWMVDFLRWLRGAAHLRSAALVAAAEAVRARLAAPAGSDSGPGRGSNRTLVDAVLQRADEPGEMLAYWMSRYGRAVPKPVKRGVADAVARLYDERALLKYDTDSHGFRFADVIDLVHPTTRADWQGALFAHALDRRHGRDNPIPEPLGMLRRRAALMAAPPEGRRALLDPETLRAAGMTWESLAGWLGGPMDAAAWCAVIPSMGYMALLRNLRNLDQAGVPDEVAAAVAARLADPDQVARSRQLPMRFLAAHRAAPSLRWSYPLERALGHALANVPALPGRTLVLVDTSSSMDNLFSRDGTVRRWDVAALFGVALGQRCAAADVVSFAGVTRWFPLVPGESLLRSLDRWGSDGYNLGGGTDTARALLRHYAGHDRVVIVTDEQAASDHVAVSEAVPAHVPMYTFNLAGYRRGHAPSGTPTRHAFGGLTDAAFRVISLIEAGQAGTWSSIFAGSRTAG